MCIRDSPMPRRPQTWSTNNEVGDDATPTRGVRWNKFNRSRRGSSSPSPRFTPEKGASQKVNRNEYKVNKVSDAVVSGTETPPMQNARQMHRSHSKEELLRDSYEEPSSSEVDS